MSDEQKIYYHRQYYVNVGNQWLPSTTEVRHRPNETPFYTASRPAAFQINEAPRCFVDFTSPHRNCDMAKIKDHTPAPCPAILRKAPVIRVPRRKSFWDKLIDLDWLF